MEIFDLVDRNRRIAEVMAECARLYGGGGALAEAKYEFWTRALSHLHPVPGQRPDTALSDVPIMKRSNIGTLCLKIVDYQRVTPGNGWLLTAVGEIPGMLKKGLRKLAGLALSQMRNGKSPPVGEIRGCSVVGDVVGLTCRVDPTAIQKVGEKVFPLIEVSYSDKGQIVAVDLMDRPSGDELRKRGSRRLARLYQREAEAEMRVTKSLVPAPVYGPRLPVTAEAAFAEIDRTEAVLKSDAGAGTWSDRLAVQAQNARAWQQVGVEFVKAARNPSNQLGGARYQVR